jgi:hypothetical protein
MVRASIVLLFYAPISWFDFNSNTECNAPDSPESQGFRIYDLILKAKSDGVNVYTIADIDEKIT